MAPPLYFLPGVTRDELVVDGRLSRPVLAARKLAETFADVGEVQTDAYVEELVGTGPGGKAGTLLMAMPISGKKPARVGYFPDHQAWTEFHAGELSYYVGLDRHDPPRPEDLARKRQVSDYVLTEEGTDDEGRRIDRQWKVPVIRNPAGTSGLPSDWIVEEDGQIRRKLKPPYRQIWEDFAGVVDVLYGSDRGLFGAICLLTDQEKARWCLAVLGVNYRFDRALQNILGVIGSDTANCLLALAVDGPTWRAVEEAGKKGGAELTDPGTRPESPATGLGPPAGSPATPPAGPS